MRFLNPTLLYLFIYTAQGVLNDYKTGKYILQVHIYVLANKFRKRHRLVGMNTERLPALNWQLNYQGLVLYCGYAVKNLGCCCMDI